ncbi:MAG TPA: exonuclease domain-containing protein [Bacteroidia bacterium]|jgi:DNA polymerase-3 subunit epsilon|nr:exonuclease domain-containing protein [Bacteroidia bacterium]
MKLNLTRPIVFFDLETTGLNIGSDRIVEVCLHKVNTDNSTETKTWRVNPQIPIPIFISKIHGIFDKDVAGCPTFKELAPQLSTFIGNADLAGFNSNKFDVPFLVEEFLRAEVDFDLKNRKLVDVQNIFHFMEPRNLKAAYKFYCDKDLINAHSAEADTIATYEIFVAQLERYENTEIKDERGNLYIPVKNDISILSTLTAKTKNADLAGRIIFNENGIEVFSFGKHKDKPVTEVFEKEPSYYNWMMQGDFPLYTKRIITQIRLGMKK